MECSLCQLVMCELIFGLFVMLGIVLMILLVIWCMLVLLVVFIGCVEYVVCGELDFVLLKVCWCDEIGCFIQVFDMMCMQLVFYLVWFIQVICEQEWLCSELEIVYQIQVVLLLNEYYFDVYCVMFELYVLLCLVCVVGGDLYSYFMFDQQYFCVMVGDVLDKGILVVLFMVCVIILVKVLVLWVCCLYQLLE